MRLDRQPIANSLQRNSKSLVVHRPRYAHAPDDQKEPSIAVHGGLPGRVICQLVDRTVISPPSVFWIAMGRNLSSRIGRNFPLIISFPHRLSFPTSMAYHPWRLYTSLIVTVDVLLLLGVVRTRCRSTSLASGDESQGGDGRG